jgi:hypothetical protein
VVAVGAAVMRSPDERVDALSHKLLLHVGQMAGDAVDR